MLTPRQAVAVTHMVELHGRELLVAPLADVVDERRRGDALLLRAELLVELERVRLDRGGRGRSLRLADPELGLDPAELLGGVLADAFGRLPTRSDVTDNPPGTVAMLQKKKVIPALLKPEDEKIWQRKFSELFKPR